ncbi:MAG: glycosyltransferase family 4 protein [Ignavibacteria bacterium]|nr:glycosyltransferase family 4 protein [Ignavibacteria bacterium]
MKVLFAGRYNSTEILSGPEKVAKRIFREYSLRDKTVFAEYFFDGNRFSYLKKLFGSELVTTVNNSEVQRFGVFSLFFFLFKYKPTVIHVITYERFALVCYLYKFFSNVKVVYNVHGIVSYENNVLKNTGLIYSLKDKICEKIFLKYSDKLIFLSDNSVKHAGRICRIGTSKISLIPNGTDEIFYKNSLDKVYNKSNPLKIVFAGDESRTEKGFDFLIDSLEKIEFHIELFLIGSFSKFKDVKNVNIKFNITDRMETDKFAGFLRDKDIFVSASSYEQFSITAAEAMTAGLVPVVTEETGMSSYIKNQINGFIFGYGNKEALIEILGLLNSDRNLMQTVSLRSTEIFKELSWPDIFLKYKNLYE